MASKKVPLVNGKYYHILNKGNNSEIIFKNKEDYEHFLNLIDKYLLLVADIYAWVLMKNHFHLLIKIKEDKDIGYLKPLSYSTDLKNCDYLENKWKTIPDILVNKNDDLNLKKPIPSRQFSHLFNAYAKYFNTKYHRTGSLFKKSFSKKIIYSKSYLQYMVYYIHHNPVHHGFVKNMIEYPWSSFLFFPSPKESYLSRDKVILWFDNINNFEEFHNTDHSFEKFKDILF